MQGTTMYKIPVWFNNNCCITIRFLVVDMKLPFVLGMEVLRKSYAQLDLKACMLTLSGDDGNVTKVLGLYKQTKALLLAVLAQLQVLEV